MENNRKIAKVYRKISINDQPSDFEYWQSQSYEDRLAALETIIREYHGWEDGFEPRLERVCRIVKTK
jgi:hypothetical protein